VEQRLGKNLPSNYPVIDRFEHGIATSIKSMDLAAPSYRNAAAISHVGQGYIDKVAQFQPRPWAGARIKVSEIQGLSMELAVPPGATTAQRQALHGLIEYGRSRGVTVRIVEAQ
jgi:filamentous hemagglutinin